MPPPADVSVAVRLSVEVGQYQPVAAGAVGMLSLMKLPFEPLSRAAFRPAVPLKLACTKPVVSSMESTVALPRALLVCVPMPKTSAPPLKLVAPPTAGSGSSRITPLLSELKSETGFCSCCASVALAAAQVAGFTVVLQV